MREHWSDKDKINSTSIKGTNLDWGVVKEPLSFTRPDVRRKIWSGHQALVRNDINSVLGVVTERYEMFQNQDAWNWAQPLVDTALWGFAKAGTFTGGRDCYILLQQEDDEFIPGDNYHQYLLLAWSHSGKKANILTPTSVRIVCQNTLNTAIMGGRKEGVLTSIKHNINMLPKFAEIQEYWTKATQQFLEQKEVMKQMLDTKMTDDRLMQFVDTLIPIDKTLNGRSLSMAQSKQSDVKRLVFGGASGHQELGIANTAYGAFQATSEYIEHVANAGRKKDPGADILWGTGNRKLKNAFSILQDVTKKEFA